MRKGFRNKLHAFVKITILTILLPCGRIASADTNQVANARQGSNAYVFQPGSARDLTKDGVWFKDAQGRFVIFRGVNIGSQTKLGAPYLYLPLRITHFADVDNEIATVSNGLDTLKDLGFNILRLPVMWKGIEPHRDTFKLDYLNGMRKFVDALYARGDFVIIDFHQDIASDEYGGDGFPDWALAVDAPDPSAFTPFRSSGAWGLRYFYPEDWISWIGFFFVGITEDQCYSVRYTLQSFWSNSTYNANANLTNYQTQSNLISTIRQTASLFMSPSGGTTRPANWTGHPAIIGYEPFNEPHPVGLCTNKMDFEPTFLNPFYQNALANIRLVDQNAFLFVEPRMDWTTYPADAPEWNGLDFINPMETNEFRSSLGSNQSFLAVGATVTDHLVFSFHYYDPWTMLQGGIDHPDYLQYKQTEWPVIFKTLVKAATSRNLIPFLTEFGADASWSALPTELGDGFYGTQDRAYLDLGFRQIETNLLNTTLWVYDLYGSKPEEGGDHWNGESFSLLQWNPNDNSRIVRNADIVARPYPMRSSAMPSFLCFNAESKLASIILTGKPVSNSNAPTVIYVPYKFQYTNQFEVRSTSSDIAWDLKSQLLYWNPDANQTNHQVIICPKGAFNPNALPEKSRQLLTNTTFLYTFP